LRVKDGVLRLVKMVCMYGARIGSAWWARAIAIFELAFTLSYVKLNYCKLSPLSQFVNPLRAPLTLFMNQLRQWHTSTSTTEASFGKSAHRPPARPLATHRTAAAANIDRPHRITTDTPLIGLNRRR
jgi:hypothetical protein